MKQGTVTLAWEGHMRLSQGNNIEMKNEILLFGLVWFGLVWLGLVPERCVYQTLLSERNLLRGLHYCFSTRAIFTSPLL